MKLRRLRKFILITGTLLCVLIAAAFVASACGWWIIVQAPSPRGPAVRLTGASAIFIADRIVSDPVLVGCAYGGLSRWNAWGRESWTPAKAPLYAVPLYAVFVAVALPTLLVWRFCPKPSKPGHCRCGYDLTGNTSGVCPECGVEVQA